LDLPLDEDYGAFGPEQRQLIAIARAIGAKASVLILDEPTASLGASEADRLFEVVDRLRANGVAILYISHRMGDIRRLADRVVVLRNGRQVFEQRRPLDLAVAIRHMVGRDLGKALTDRAGGASGEPALRLDQVQLRADSSPFDLEIRADEIIAVTGALGSGKSNLRGLSSASPNSHQAAPSSMASNGVRMDPPTRLPQVFFWQARTVGEARFCRRTRRAATSPGPSLCLIGANGFQPA